MGAPECGQAPALAEDSCAEDMVSQGSTGLQGGTSQACGGTMLKELASCKGPPALGAQKGATPWSGLSAASNPPPKGPV